MEGVIKPINGVYPITVMDAVKLGDGSNKTIKHYIDTNINALKSSIEYNKKMLPFNFSAMEEAMEANTSTTASLEVLTGSFGTLQFVGGTCINNKIFFAPNTSDSVLVYDITNNLTYRIGQGLGTYAFKYTGCVTYKGYIYMIPRGVNNILRVNPVTEEVEKIELGTDYVNSQYNNYTDSHHYCGAISDDGILYMPPSYAGKHEVLKVDLNTFKVSKIKFTPYNDVFIGCYKHPKENKMFFLSTGRIVVWNCDDDTIYRDITTEVKGCYDVVYDPRYNCIYGMYPYNGVTVDQANNGCAFALNVDTYEIKIQQMGNIYANGYGIMLGIDGKIYKFENKRAYSISFNGTTFSDVATYNASGANATSPYNAGIVLTNNGDIYGVPANGGVVRLKMSGIVKKVPDYITSSQFYGKY